MDNKKVGNKTAYNATAAMLELAKAPILVGFRINREITDA